MRPAITLLVARVCCRVKRRLSYTHRRVADGALTNDGFWQLTETGQEEGRMIGMARAEKRFVSWPLRGELKLKAPVLDSVDDSFGRSAILETSIRLFEVQRTYRYLQFESCFADRNSQAKPDERFLRIVREVQECQKAQKIHLRAI